MKKRISILLLVLLGSGFFAVPKAKAMDPVTIAILAPVAMKVAETAQPYIINGISCAARGLAKAGIAGFQTLYLPLGIVECTFGFPLGGLGPGVNNIVEGGSAPFEMVYHIVMLPVNLCGVDI